MKKISVISMLLVLVLPAFAQSEVTYLYGDPANIKLLGMSKLSVSKATEQQALTQPEQQIDSEKTAEQKVSESKVEEQKNKKQETKTSQVKKQETKSQQIKEAQIEQHKTEEQKFESKTVSNPKAKFPHGLQLGVGLSPTSGLNTFIGYNNKNFDSFWWKRFGFRLDFATYSPIKNRLNKTINHVIGDDGLEIDDALKIENFAIGAKHYGALVDFYPFGDTWFLGGFRVSGGYMIGNLELGADIHGTENSGKIEFELGGRKYAYDDPDVRGNANVNWKYHGPYAGAGFDLGLFYGVKIYFDAGVVFADNNAKIDLSVPTEGLYDITSGAPEAVTGSVKTEYEKAKAKALSEAQEEMDKLDYYPIVKLGFMYRF